VHLKVRREVLGAVVSPHRSCPQRGTTGVVRGHLRFLRPFAFFALKSFFETVPTIPLDRVPAAGDRDPLGHKVARL